MAMDEKEKKQHAMRQKRYVEKMNEKGYYNFQAWVKRDHQGKIIEFIDSLD